ncbi:hypothetical protein [Alkalibacillus haloalkaliphilus]|uniref:hypothetical protein n=1 Tax=Alkalibacillus haloalkaliphilus TaxID=94136 RepID=UPI0002F52C4B|nr:hypothetical protein [Alkalibacillus haloalkaliphilus]
MLDAIRDFIDTIFEPPLTFLDLAIENLQSVSIITAQGIDLSNYTMVFRDMPSEWQMVVQSLLMAMVMIGTLLLFRLVLRTYYAVKDGVKWW